MDHCLYRHVALVPQFHAFVGSLTHLTHLKLSNCCTDQLLAVIGANCKSLEVLDAEEARLCFCALFPCNFRCKVENIPSCFMNAAADCSNRWGCGDILKFSVLIE